MVIRLGCSFQSYDWGKLGSESAVANFRFLLTGEKPDDSLPYAELWMGTHPSCPTTLKSSNVLLRDEIRGTDVLLDQEGRLPFLLKVLSIGKALSIQAHPDKTLAEKLHKRDPKHYRDDNHKPEVAIALTDFRGLCGFRVSSEIVENIKMYPSLSELVGSETVENFKTKQDKDSLRTLFSEVMKKNAEEVTKYASLLIERDIKTRAQNTDLDLLLLELNQQFPLDVGLFNVLLLNVVQLHPGEAIYLKANEVHAYISGDIIECMAASDNVVRAGFTPKFKDVSTLVDMLTYETYTKDDLKLQPIEFKGSRGDGKSEVFDPKVPEFKVVKTDIPPYGTHDFPKGFEGPTVFICTNGSGTMELPDKTETVKQGDIFYISRNIPLKLMSEKDSNITLFFALPGISC